MRAIETLEDRLNYRFANKALLLTALTHPSFAADHHEESYQRMEFLGDAVLELAVSRHLYLEEQGMDEGHLSRRRAALVNEDALSGLARAFELGAYIRFSNGEEKSGGRDKPSILADAFEAVLAAIYLDGGMDAAYQLVERAYKDLFLVDGALEDWKTALQERLQKLRGEAPGYEMLSRTGPDHDPRFTVRVLIGGREIARGEGRSKQAAQQQAARAALQQHFPEE